jgi:hypothetical protein
MNGFLFLISSHTLWVESGQLYLYDSDISTVIGGYPVGTILGMSDGSGTWLNTRRLIRPTLNAGGVGWIPRFLAMGLRSVAVTGGTVTSDSEPNHVGA